jgi:hypothetical protein
MKETELSSGVPAAPRKVTMTIRALLLVACAALLWSRQDSQPVQCDIKTVVKGYWCDGCKLGLDKTELTGTAQVLYCESCQKAWGQGTKCATCGKELTRKEPPKDACRHCLTKPAAADLCSKQGFVCAKCFKGYAAIGKCTLCNAELEPGSVRAHVTYECPECKTTATAAAKCAKPGCKANGSDMAARCSMSGRAPHVP